MPSKGPPLGLAIEEAQILVAWSRGFEFVLCSLSEAAIRVGQK
jgi:hypothetical protein